MKAFTAVELDYIPESEIERGRHVAIECGGLDSPLAAAPKYSIPKYGEQICADKVDADGWLAIHEAAHKLRMHSNATMLYGHIEKFEHRVDHMRRLRELQDRTGGVQYVHSLKFRNQDNDMSHVAESSVKPKTCAYAIARIYLDNFPHLKLIGQCWAGKMRN